VRHRQSFDRGEEAARAGTDAGFARAADQLVYKPLDQPGEYAIPRRGEKSFSGVGAIVEGTPGSPGSTYPVGAPGNWTEFSPNLNVEI
jgi:hypothetical protein